MAQIINRDGKDYSFPDNFTQEQIDNYFNNLENTQPEEVTEEAEEEKRGLLTDVPAQAIGGLFDAGKSAVRLIEGVAQDAKKATGYGGWTFGENAENGFAQYHSYEDVIKNNIKLPVSGDVTKVGDTAIEEAIPDIDEADTTTGAVTRSISQFLSGWYLTAPIKPLKVAKGATATTAVTKSVTRGAVADFVAFDEETGRFMDMVNTQFPSLQNPLFEYLSSEGKEESFYEARFKNAVEGALLGGVMEGIVRGAAPFLKEQLTGMGQWIKLKRKALAGEKVDSAKLARIEKGLREQSNEQFTAAGKDSRKKFVASIMKEAEDSAKVTQTLDDIKKTGADTVLANRMVGNFGKYFDRVRAGEKTVRSRGKLNWREIDEAMDLGLSPRAYADTDFGIIALNSIRKVINSEKKFDVMSTEIIERQATKMGYDPIQTTKMLGQLGNKLEGGLKFMYASQAIQQNLADALYKMSVGLSKGTKEYTEKEAMITTALLMRLMRFDDKVASNLGRGLNLRGILKDQNVDLGRDQILNLVRGMDSWGGDFKAFYNGIAMVKDKNMLTRIIDFAFRNKFWNRANELWMSAALSNPKTQIINVVSTANNLFLRPAQSWLGSKLTWGLDDFTKAQMKEHGTDIAHTVAGYRSYLHDALRFTKKAFNDEDSILFAGSTKFDTNTKALGTSELAKKVRIPLRGLTAMDEFFKQISYRARLSSIATREAIEKGASKDKIVLTLKDGTKVSEFDEAVAKRFRAGFDESGLIALDKEASRFAKEVTFTKELDGVLGHIQQMTNQVPILKQILPFVKTPSNLAIQAVEMTPLGILGKNFDNFTGASRDAVRIAEVRGRLAVGTIILGSISMLNLTGAITGGYHPDKAIRKQQQSQGFQPYSVKIPGTDTYVEYGRLDPIGMLIGLVADYGNIYGDLNEADRLKVENNLLSFIINQQTGAEEDLDLGTKVSNAVIAGYKAGFKNIASKTYLKGLVDFVSSFDGNQVDKKGMWWLENKAASYVPNILSKVLNDPFLRETEGFMEAYQKRLGGIGLPKQYNLLGEPITSGQGNVARLFNSIFNPFTVKTQKDDIVLKTLIENEINIPQLDSVKNGLDLKQFINPDTGKSAFVEWNEAIGNSSLRKNLERLIKSQQFKDADPRITLDENNKFGGKHLMVYDMIKEARDMAFLDIEFSDKYVFESNPELTLGEAYLEKDLIKDIGKVTGKSPVKKKKVFDFIDQTK